MLTVGIFSRCETTVNSKEIQKINRARKKNKNDPATGEAKQGQLSRERLNGRHMTNLTNKIKLCTNCDYLIEVTIF